MAVVELARLERRRAAAERLSHLAVAAIAVADDLEAEVIRRELLHYRATIVSLTRQLAGHPAPATEE